MAFAGGSLPKILGQEIKEFLDEIESSMWIVLLLDERCVDADSDDLSMNAL